MPVSNPSYFPPQRTGDVVVGLNAGTGLTNATQMFLAGAGAAQYVQGLTDIIVIGHDAFDAGTLVAPITDTTLDQSIFIGTNVATSLTTGGAASGTYSSGNTIIGHGAAASIVYAGANTILGANAASSVSSAAGLQSANRLKGNVIVGDSAYAGCETKGGITTTPADTVIIGYEAFGGAAAVQPNYLGGNQLVCIGSQALGSQGAGNNPSTSCTYSNSVYIGYRCAYSGGVTNNNTSDNVYVGSSISPSAGFTNTDNVLLGYSIGLAAQTCQYTVGIGASINALGDSSVVIGRSAVPNSHKRLILIGRQCGSQGSGVGADDLFILETYDGATQRAMFYGDLAKGNLVVGNSTTAAAGRGWGGGTPTNNLKLLNGAAPTSGGPNGGQFYAVGGILFYIDQNSVTTTLSLNANGQLANNQSGSNYTNNAGAQAGTLTNSPTAGNPTAWIPINDNGTIRNIPAW